MQLAWQKQKEEKEKEMRENSRKAVIYPRVVLPRLLHSCANHSLSSSEPHATLVCSCRPTAETPCLPPASSPKLTPVPGVRGQGSGLGAASASASSRNQSEAGLKRSRRTRVCLNWSLKPAHRPSPLSRLVSQSANPKSFISIGLSTRQSSKVLCFLPALSECQVTISLI